MDQNDFSILKEDLNKISDNLSNSSMRIIFVKHTSTRTTLNDKDFATIDIEGEIPPFFRSSVEKYINQAKNNFQNISPFFEGINDNEEILYWSPTDELPFLSNIIEYCNQSKKIENHKEISDKLINSIRFYYLKLDIDIKNNEYLLCFKRYYPIKNISQSKYFFRNKDGLFNKIDGSLLKLDDSFDVLSYISEDKVKWTLIFVEKKFEEIFHVFEKYFQEAEKVFKYIETNCKFIKIDKKIQEKGCTQRGISKRITKFSRLGHFKKLSLDYIIKNIDERNNISLTHKNNVVNISNDKEFTEFLNISAGLYYNDKVNDPLITCYTPYKIPLTEKKS